MTSQTDQNKDIVRRSIEGISTGDLEAFLRDAADDVTFKVIGQTSFSGDVSGKKIILKGLKRAVGQGLEGGRIKMTIQNLIAEGNFVAEQTTGEARTVAGEDYNNTYCRVWEIEDGQVQVVTEYLDTELLRDVLAK